MAYLPTPLVPYTKVKWQANAIYMITVKFVNVHAYQHQVGVRHERRFLMLSLRCATLAVMVFVVMDKIVHCAVQIQFRVFLYQAVVFAGLARTGHLQAGVRPVKTRFRPQAARPSPRVSATPGGREGTATALHVRMANTRL